MTTLSQMITRIDDKASTIDPRRVAIGAVTMPLWLVGFIIGVVFRGLWLVGVYLWSAGAVGFQAGFGRKG